jgi:lysophospholipase L1-like esterase
MQVLGLTGILPISGLLRRFAFWALLPLTGVQGLFLRRKALRLPPPPGDVSGYCGQGSVLHLVALGDSIIAGIGAAEREHTLPVQYAEALSTRLNQQVAWHAEGENGAKISDLLVRLRAMKPPPPADVILLSIGVNDVTGLSSTRQWRQQLITLVEELRSSWPQALVVFAGLPPMEKFPLPPHPLRFSLGLRAGIFDRIARTVISPQKRMLHLPTEINPQQHGFCADGFHPCAESYAIWGSELANRTYAQIA